MVFLNSGRNQIRNFLATGSANYPDWILFGSDSTSADKSDTTMSTVLIKDFEDVITSVTRQTKYEGLIVSTEMTGSDLAQIGIGSESSGTSGTVFLKENINPITKTDNFDVQVTSIIEVT